jgi:putative sigma-54 modulation protein
MEGETCQSGFGLVGSAHPEVESEDAMLVTMLLKGVRVSPGEERSLQSKLRQAFGRFQRSIQQVDLAVEDVNGPKGGVDKRCRLTVCLPRQRDLVLEERGTDVLPAVHQLIDRTVVAVSRLRERRQTRRRGVPRTSVSGDAV